MKVLRLALLSLAGLVAIFLGWTFLHEARDGARNERRASPQEVAAMRRAIERAVSGAPDYAGFFDGFQTAFPAEYESFVTRSAERAATNGDPANVDALMIEAARGLRRSHGVLAAKADGPSLDHYFDARLAVLSALAERDKSLCVDFLYGGGSGDFTAFSRSHRGLVAALVNAGLDAVKNGRIKRMSREAPTDDDFRVLEGALRMQGLSGAEIGALLDGKPIVPPPADEEMCKAGEIYLQTLSALPDATRRRIYGFAVELMARS